MSRPAAPRPHPATPLLVLLLLVASLAPLGVAQAPSPCEPRCLRIDSLSMDESPVVAQGDNTLEGVIANEGRTPAEVRAHFHVTWDAGAGDRSASSPPTTYLIGGGMGQDVSWTWEGPPVDDRAESVKIVLHAWVETGNQEVDGTRVSKSIPREVRYHNFTLEALESDDGFDPDWSPPETIDRGHTDTIARVRLTNTGNVADTARLSIPPQAGWDLVPVPGQVLLQPGESKNVSVRATAPPQDGARADFLLQAETSERRADNADGGLSPLRAELGMTTPTVVDGTSLRVTIDNPTKHADVDTGVAYVVEVYNPTDAAKEAKISFGHVDGTLQDIDLSLPSGTTQKQKWVNPGQAVQFDLQASVSPTAFAGTRTWWVKIEDLGDDSDTTHEVHLTVNQTHAVDAAVDGSQAPPMFSPVRGSEVLPGDPDIDLPLREAPGSRSITWVDCGGQFGVYDPNDCAFVDMDDDQTVSKGDIVLFVAGAGDVQPGGTMDEGNVGIGTQANGGAFLPAFIDQDGSGDRSQGDIIVLDDPGANNIRRGVLSSGDIYLSGPQNGTVETQDSQVPLVSLPADVGGFCYVDGDGDGGFQRTERVYFAASCTNVVPGDVRISNVLSFPPRLSAVPSQTMTIPLLVSNLGNGNDTICIQAQLPADWGKADSSCTQVTPLVDPQPAPGASPWNHTVPFQWNLTLEPWAPSGQQDITFHARSEGGNQSDPLTITLDVPNRTHPVLVTPPGQPRPPALDPTLPCVLAIGGGTQRSVPIGLRNDGNVDGNFTFHVSPVAEEPAGGWTVTAPASTHAMAKGGQKAVAFTVGAPQLPAPGDHVELRVRLDDADGGPVAEEFCRVRAAFPDLAVLEADALTTPRDLYAGHPSVLHFQVANAGWSATGDPVQVRSLIKDPDGVEVEQTHVLEPLDAYPGTWWRDLAVHFNATKAGNYTYTVEVDPDHLIDEPDEDGGGAPNTLTGDVTVHDFGVVVDAPPGRTAIPEQTVAFEALTDTAFVVRNTGQDTHALTLHLAMEPAWKTFEAQTVTLGPGQSHFLNVTLAVPETPFVPEVSLTLRAANATLPTLAREDTVRVRIDDDAPPAITGFSSNTSHVLVGDSVGFSVQITDAAGVAEARLILVAPDGTVSSRALEGGPVGAFSASASFDSIGNHTAYVWARDGAVSNNSADTSATPLQVEVLPSDRPHVRLVTPDDGSYLRPGVPVVLTVLSRQPIVHAQYQVEDLEAVPVPFANPLQLATDAWPEGPARVRIDVRDALGVQANGTYAFRVDGTPPVVAELQLDPTEPGRVRVVAVLEDESGVAEAEVRITRTGGQTDTVALVEDGSAWEAEVALPKGVVSATVVATDLAGNRGWGERTLEGLHDVDDKGLPLPALPLLVAALAAAVWHSRRRGSR